MRKGFLLSPSPKKVEEKVVSPSKEGKEASKEGKEAKDVIEGNKENVKSIKPEQVI